MVPSEPVQVRFAGELACFTRPELKVERVSYPAMTPSAARGALEAILWKPEFRWAVDRIDVLRPVQFIGVRRNEVQVKLPSATAERLARAGAPASEMPPLFADSRRRGRVATQRNTLALRDVAYLVHARILVRDEAAGAGNTPTKYREMFLRRVQRGQCWQQPYLGCREFAAFFAPPDASDQPIAASANLGLMLYDVIFEAGKNEPVFFPALLQGGRLDTNAATAVPDESLRRRLGLC